MAKIVIKRSSEFRNKARKIPVYINDVQKTMIADGGIEEIELAAGTYKVQAKIDWCGSPALEVSIAENETRFLRLSSFPYSNLFTILSGVCVLGALGLKIANIGDYILPVAAPFALVSIYYYTIGRYRYLQLVETDMFG